LARVAGNRVFESVLCTIYDNINRYFDEYLPRDEKISEKTYKDLCRILRAIEAKQPDIAKHLAKKHVRWFNKAMRRSVVEELVRR
jgi:DNA-binding FadR family transcriptional regulator